ncbi:MAG: hypothetical protein JOZ78_03920 [Chroococcidiopsidaceae cyanobacterium CP_BM_ER_R8_30]|nr:hypothetical protein [Chroococcidiopsidaceae cyanobacterium CP_BM_ER_R8_30]
MTLTPSTQINPKQAEKLIKKSAKQVMSASGIAATTHRGNKEFKYLVKQLSQQAGSTSEQAVKLGEDLGQKVVAMSQTLGKKRLNRGVMRQLVKQGEIPAVTKVPKPQPETQPLASTQEQVTSQNQAATPRSQPLSDAQSETPSDAESSGSETATAQLTTAVAQASEEVVPSDAPKLTEEEEPTVED